MAIPQYAVPNVAGVPAINFLPGFGAGISLLIADATDLGQSDQTWGVYLNGTPIITAESVTAFSYRREFAISDYPVEQGGFESFDKVALPRDVHMRFTAGSAAARQELLSSIDAVISTTQLVDFVTPDAVYTNINLSHEDYDRRANRGLGLLQVEVWGLEIRQATSSSASPTSALPSGAAQSADGTVTPTDPSATQKSVLSTGDYGDAGLVASSGSGGIGSQ